MVTYADEIILIFHAKATKHAQSRSSLCVKPLRFLREKYISLQVSENAFELALEEHQYFASDPLGHILIAADEKENETISIYNINSKTTQ